MRLPKTKTQKRLDALEVSTKDIWRNLTEKGSDLFDVGNTQTQICKRLQVAENSVQDLLTGGDNFLKRAGMDAGRIKHIEDRNRELLELVSVLTNSVPTLRKDIEKQLIGDRQVVDNLILAVADLQANAKRKPRKNKDK